MLHIKELGPKIPRYLIKQHFSRPRYKIHDNIHKSDNYFLSMRVGYTCEITNTSGYKSYSIYD